jgi:8-oxo-dGTP diphosphatase
VSCRPPPKHAVPVVCGIIEHRKRFLAALRGSGQSNSGLWEFPGGKIRPGESAEAALLRELREELDIEVSVETRLLPNIYSYPGITIKLIPFLCSIVRGKPQPCEHAEVRWLGIREAQTLAWAPADIPVLTEYLSLKQSCLCDRVSRNTIDFK